MIKASDYAKKQKSFTDKTIFKKTKNC